MDILNSRENRGLKQIDLLEKYGNTLISFTVNSPGINKDDKIYREIHNIGYESIVKVLDHVDILYSEKVELTTGDEAYLIVDYPAKDVKEIMIDIEENHELGRIFDIDVFDRNHKQIGRKDIGRESRLCLMCDNEARVCMREKAHTYEELIDYIGFMYKEYLNSRLISE